MSKTVTIDTAVILQVRLTPGANGEAEVHCEYQLRSGATPIQSLHQEVTTLLTPSQRATARAFLDAITQAIAADQGVAATTTWS